MTATCVEMEGAGRGVQRSRGREPVEGKQEGREDRAEEKEGGSGGALSNVDADALGASQIFLGLRLVIVLDLRQDRLAHAFGAQEVAHCAPHEHHKARGGEAE